MDSLKKPDFKQWLVDLKTRIRQSQIKAAIKVNDEMSVLGLRAGYCCSPNGCSVG